MAIVPNVDSNQTGLRYAVEDSPGVLPGSPVWRVAEPNDYKDFGGEVKTKARKPINASRQLKKGNVVDLDVKGGYSSDVTPYNCQDLMQSVFFAALRTKGELSVATVDGSGNDYEPASGGIAYVAGELLFAKDFAIDANNGLKVVSGDPVAASVPVTDTGLLAETGATGTISKVGVQLPSGLASIVVSGDLPTLVMANVFATGTLDATSSTIGDGDTVTIDGQAYAFETGALDAPYKVKVGIDDSTSLDNLIAAINGAAGIGSLYATGTAVHPTVSAAAAAGDTVTLTARLAGVAGNLIATTTTIGSATLGATLGTGAGYDLTRLGVIPGEFVYVGSDETDTSFSDPEDNGFCRVRSVTASVMTFDKTQDTMVANNGSAKTIRVYVGRALKNESDPTLIIKRTIQLERTLGAPDASQPTQIQAEYLTACLIDKTSFGASTADLFKVDFEVLGADNELRSAATGVKSGSRPDVIEADAFNTTSDISFIKLAVVTEDDACPDPLFSYLTDLKFEVNNNVTQNKALSRLGAFSSTAGDFMVTAEVSGYFQTVAVMTAVRNNDTLTLECHFARGNKGMSFDVPVLAASKALPEVKQDAPIMLPLSADAGTGALIDASLNHTAFMVFWDYLPDVAQ